MLPQRLPLAQMQVNWAQELNPIIAFPPINGVLLTNIMLKTGVNTVNHKLQRNQQGWIITDQDGVATIYRSKPLNNLTLTLTASADVNVSLWVY